MFCFALFRSFLIVYTSYALNCFYKSIITCRLANNVVFRSFNRVVVGEFSVLVIGSVDVGVEHQGPVVRGQLALIQEFHRSK